MPKSYMHTVRGYKTGQYFGGSDYDPYVMTTRSGLSIKKIPVNTKPGSQVRQPPPPVIKETSETTASTSRKKRNSALKYRSMSYMSFVTRFHLCLRVPELDLAGVNPRETLQYTEGRPFSCSDDDSDDDDDDDDDVRDNEEDTKEIDNFILSVAEDLNNNERGSVDVVNNERDTVDVVTIHNDKETDKVSDSEFLKQKWFLSEFGCSLSEGIPPKYVDSDAESSESVIDGKTSFPVSQDSDDASSITSDTYIDVETSPMHCNGGSMSPITHSVRLGDLQLKIVEDLDGKKLVKCTECEKVFSMISAYSSHLKTHVKSKNTCNICGKVFTRSWLLKGHIRTHTGERPFPCPHKDCTKAFADKSNLRSHLMIHTAVDKNYTCKKCGRAFAQKRYLHKHMLEVCRLI